MTTTTILILTEDQPPAPFLNPRSPTMNALVFDHAGGGVIAAKKLPGALSSALMLPRRRITLWSPLVPHD